MGLRINTNVASIAAQKNLRQTSEKQGSVLQKLASGNKIVRAADDSAGLAISEKMIRDSGGTLTLEPSENGACFRVTLPRREPTNFTEIQQL